MKNIHRHIHILDDLENDVIESIFATSVEAYVFDSFNAVNAGFPRREELDTYSLYRYLLFNAKQILNETDFSTAHASYLALDYNLNDPGVSEKLQEKNKEKYVLEESDNFKALLQSSWLFSLVVCIAIGAITVALVPMFFGSRRYVAKMYSVLEELYSFELKFQTIKLEELEDGLELLNRDSFAFEQRALNRQA